MKRQTNKKLVKESRLFFNKERENENKEFLSQSLVTLQSGFSTLIAL